MLVEGLFKTQLKGLVGNAFKTRFSKDVFYMTKEIYQAQKKWGKIQTDDCQTKPGIINDPISSPTPESRWSLLNRVKSNNEVIDYILETIVKESPELGDSKDPDSIDIQDPDFIEKFFKILKERKHEFFDTSTNSKYVKFVVSLLRKTYKKGDMTEHLGLNILHRFIKDKSITFRALCDGDIRDTKYGIDIISSNGKTIQVKQFIEYTKDPKSDDVIITYISPSGHDYSKEHVNYLLFMDTHKTKSKWRAILIKNNGRNEMIDKKHAGAIRYNMIINKKDILFGKEFDKFEL